MLIFVIEKNRFPNDIFCLLIGKTDLVALKKLLVSDLPKTMDFELPFLQSARRINNENKECRYFIFVIFPDLYK